MEDIHICMYQLWMSQILMMMIKMMMIIQVSKIENICGRRPLPPIISHSFPLSNSALSSIGSRKLPVQVEVEVLLLSHRKIPLQLCSQQRIGVKPITNGDKSYFSSHQVWYLGWWRWSNSIANKNYRSINSLAFFANITPTICSILLINAPIHSHNRTLFSV